MATLELLFRLPVVSVLTHSVLVGEAYVPYLYFPSFHLYMPEVLLVPIHCLAILAGAWWCYRPQNFWCALGVTIYFASILNGSYLQGNNGDVLLRNILIFATIHTLSNSGLTHQLIIRLLLLQLSMVYIFTGVNKWNTYWFNQNTLLFALELPRFSGPLAGFFMEIAKTFPWLAKLTPIGQIVSGTIFLAQILLGQNKALQTLFISNRMFLICIHLAFAFALETGIFQFTMIAAVFASGAPMGPLKLDVGLGGLRSAFARILVVLYTVGTVEQFILNAVSPRYMSSIFGDSLQLNQVWSLFSPFPPRYHDLHVLQKGTSDGKWETIPYPYGVKNWRVFLSRAEKRPGIIGHFMKLMCTQHPETNAISWVKKYRYAQLNGPWRYAVVAQKACSDRTNK